MRHIVGDAGALLLRRCSGSSSSIGHRRLQRYAEALAEVCRAAQTLGEPNPRTAGNAAVAAAAQLAALTPPPMPATTRPEVAAMLRALNQSSRDLSSLDLSSLDLSSLDLSSLDLPGGLPGIAPGLRPGPAGLQP